MDMQIQQEHLARRLQGFLERLHDRHVGIAQQFREDFRRAFHIREHGPGLALYMAFQHGPTLETVFPGDDEERLRLCQGRRHRRHVCRNARPRSRVRIVEGRTQRLGFVLQVGYGRRRWQRPFDLLRHRMHLPS